MNFIDENYSVFGDTSGKRITLSFSWSISKGPAFILTRT